MYFSSKPINPMSLRNVLTVFLLVLMTSPAFCQELKTPSEGKALIYVARMTSTGAAINFKYFIDDQYIGKFNGSNYMVVECDPGEHLIWASSENRDFLISTLEANKVYVIEAIVNMGALKARVNITPLLKSDEKNLQKFQKLIAKKEPVELDSSKVASEGIELQDFIADSLEKYKDKSEEKEFEILSADMNF